MSDFPKYPKTPRFNMGCLVTEKIDGTNALIEISVNPPAHDGGTGSYTVRAGSRKRWLTPEQDNFGFARFVAANEQWLIDNLGVGLHYGEWWGKGIQRGYGQEQKQLALFDGPGRYPVFVDHDAVVPHLEETAKRESWISLPTKSIQLEGGGIGVVPFLYQGPLDVVLAHLDDDAARENFLPDGSKAAPGWWRSEGVIVQLRGSGGGQRFKIVWDKG